MEQKMSRKKDTMQETLNCILIITIFLFYQFSTVINGN